MAHTLEAATWHCGVGSGAWTQIHAINAFANSKPRTPLFPTGASSGEDGDDRRQLDASAYLICTRKRFELSPGRRRNPALDRAITVCSGRAHNGFR
jgi:hypothetical protein